jgi:hypothetical protein
MRITTWSKFTLPEFVGGDQWLTFIDTNDPERGETSTLKAWP